MASTRSAPAKQKRSPARPKGPATPKAGGLEESIVKAIPPKFHTAAFLGLIFFALLVFFGGVIFSNKVFVSHDFISWEAYRPYIEFMNARGESPLWMPYIFSGMPGIGSFLMTGDRWWDLTMTFLYGSERIISVVNYPVMRVVCYYFIYGAGMYLLMRTRKASRSTAFFVALAAMFSTWVIIYIMISHNTKIMALMTFPYIFLCMDHLIKRWSLLYAGLLILSVHLLYEASHLQSAFYAACAIAIYMTVELVTALRKKEPEEGDVKGVLRTTGLLLVAVAATYGMSIDRNAEVSRYLEYSTREAPSIDSAKGAGQGYEYSTNWSFSPAETITYLIPGYFGTGRMEYSGPRVKATQHIPTYWGQMAFTDTAHYMGIVVLVLGIFGAWKHRRKRFVQALIAIGLFGLLLSYGRNMSLLYDLFYNFVPNFSKFRAPSQSLVLLEFVFPILAGLGLESIVSMQRSGEKGETSKKLLYGAIGFGVFTLVGLTGMIKGSYQAAINSAAVEPGMDRGYLTDPDIFDMIYGAMQIDWIIAGLTGVATLLLMYYYLNGRITTLALKSALVAILLVDLWHVAYRPMETKPASILTDTFRETDIDRRMKQDTTPHRMIDLAQPEYPNFAAAHFQENIMGYSSVKMRAYQDFLDIAGDGQMPTSITGWRMLNTKYFIVDKPNEQMSGFTVLLESNQRLDQGGNPIHGILLRDERTLPRAWFVNRVEVAQPRAILEKIRDNAFDPHDLAYVQAPLKQQIQPVGYAPPSPPIRVDTGNPPPPDPGSDGEGTVKFTRREPLHLEMEVYAPGTNFLVVSEMHYPAAWEAKIDGKPAEIVRTNYILRGLVVPPGKHRITMDYEHSAFERGKWISLGLNIIMFSMIIVGFVLYRKKNRAPNNGDAS